MAEIPSGGDAVKTTIRAIFAIAFIAGVAPAMAAEDIQARSWAATCTGCHGTNGHSEGGIPGIAGLDKDQFVSLMLEFKNDRRPATVMHQHAKGYTDEQIERMAVFFSAQKRR
jgi:cytochrome subunit of sulfide dehydrogenase